MPLTANKHKKDLTAIRVIITPSEFMAVVIMVAIKITRVVTYLLRMKHRFDKGRIVSK